MKSNDELLKNEDKMNLTQHLVLGNIESGDPECRILAVLVRVQNNFPVVNSFGEADGTEGDTVIGGEGAQG